LIFCRLGYACAGYASHICEDCISGLPDFSWSKFTKMIKNYIQSPHKLYQTAINYTKWPYNILNGHFTFYILRPSKFYPNRDFWFENKPSGNPATYVYFISDSLRLCTTH
jgi:hypothetical protein